MLAAQAPSQPPTPTQKAVVQIAAFFVDNGKIRSKDENDRRVADPRTGSGIVIGPEGLILTAAHVLRQTGAGCGEPIDPESPLTPILIVLVTEDANQPPKPRFIARLLQDEAGQTTEDLRLDLALLQITGRFTGAGIEDLADLKSALADLPQEDFQARFTAPLDRALSLDALLLGDSSGLRAELLTNVGGYPVISEVPRITVTEGPIAQAPFEEDFFLVNRAFATFGNSGGAVLDRETNFLVGVLCGGQAGVAGEVLAKAVLINKAKALINPQERGIEQPPVARFSIGEFPRPGEAVTLDASDSFDPDGQIVKYEWDFDARVDADGDGDPENDVQAEGRTVSQAFETSGVKRVVLRVEDADGLVARRTQTVLVRGGGPDRRRELQNLIDAAAAGDTVTIPPGEYFIDGSLFIEKPLTLQGEGVTLFGNGWNPVLDVRNTDNVRLEGLTISTGKAGILVEGSRAVTLVNVTLRENLRRGLFVRASQVEVLQSEIADNAVDVDGTQGQGVWAENGSLVRMKAGNIIEGNDDAGIAVQNAAAEVEASTIRGNRNKGVSVSAEEAVFKTTLVDTVIEGNRISGVFVRRAELEIRGGRIAGTQRVGREFGEGLVAEENSQVTIAGGRIEGNEGAGLTITDATVEIEENTVISDNNDDGLSLSGSAQATLTDSTVSGNVFGLFLFGSAQATLTDSQVSDNGRDGLLLRDSAQATLNTSQVSDNGFGLSLSGSAQAIIENNEIKDNDGWGVALFQAPCFDTDEKFTGKVEGKGNVIEGNGQELSEEQKQGGDGTGEVCPAELEFLKTEEGGQYP